MAVRLSNIRPIIGKKHKIGILKLFYVFILAKWFKYCWLTKDPAFCSEDSKNSHKNKPIETGIILLIVDI